MAIYPCDFTSHRYPQPQQAAYISVVRGVDAQTFRLRLCPSHFRQVVVASQRHLLAIDEDSDSSAVCTSCSGEREAIIFSRLFPSKQEEQTFAADLCSACANAAIAELLPASARPLPPR